MAANDQLLEHIGNLIDQKLEPVKKDLQEVKQGVLRVEQKLDREVTDLAENIQAIMTKLDRIDDLETRVTQLEEDTMYPSH